MTRFLREARPRCNRGCASRRGLLRFAGDDGSPAERRMNGAECLVGTLADEGVEMCFANPGTSEMHVLAALETAPLRSVLCLFEGVCTGAADGWYRMRDAPAATLLHLGP